MTENKPPVANKAGTQRAWLDPSLVGQPEVVHTPEPTPIAAHRPPAGAPSAAPALTPVTNPTQPASPTQQSAPPKQRTLRKHHVLLPLISLIVLALGGAAKLYLTHHSFVAVSIAGTPATRRVESAELASQLRTAASHYRLAISTPDGKTTSYSLAEAGIAPDIPATIASAHGQHGVTVWRTAHLPLILKTNKAALTTFITEHTVQATTPAQDATLLVHGNEAKTTPEQAGQGYSLPSAPQTIQQAAAQLNPQPLALRKGAIQPLITERSLQAKKNELRKILAQNITFTIAGNTERASGADIGSWLDLSPVPAAGTVDISANSGKIAAYIEGLTQQYTTAASETLGNIQPDGSLSIIINNGSARKVTNEGELVTTLASKLLSGTGQTASVGLSEQSAAKTINAHSYDKWLLVNVSSKRMYAYEGTNLVKTFFVTAGAPATPTVQGTYKIYAKYRSQDMAGSNADGSRYFQPNVEYVNYFYKDYAVHGNYWRPTSYFGNVNSSHGCVGIVNADAAWVYEWAPIGTTVMVHS